MLRGLISTKRGMNIITISRKPMLNFGRQQQSLQIRSTSSIKKPEPEQTIESSSPMMPVTSWLLRRSKYFVAASFGLATLDGLTCGLGLFGYVLMNECGYACARKWYNVPSIPVVCRIPATDIVMTLPVLRVEHPGSYLEEARGGAISCLAATYFAGSAGYLLDSQSMMEICYVGAHMSVANICLPVTSFDAARLWGQQTWPFWCIQGSYCTALFSLPMMAPNFTMIGGMLGTMAVCTTCKEWHNRHKREGYYQETDHRELSKPFWHTLTALAILIFVCKESNSLSAANNRIAQRLRDRISVAI